MSMEYKEHKCIRHKSMDTLGFETLDCIQKNMDPNLQSTHPTLTQPLIQPHSQR